MPELVPWGIDISPDIPKSLDLGCRFCPWSIFRAELERDDWRKYVVGFNPHPPVSHCKDLNMVGAFVIECPKCFSRFWFHVTETNYRLAEGICPNWPK